MENIVRIFIINILLLFIFTTEKAEAQQLNMDVRDFNGNIQIFDPANPSSKNNVKQSYADVEGSPFWDEKWNPAIVYFNNGTKAKINQARLNLYTDEIHYINSVGTELAIENQGITRLVFLNQNNLTQPIASFAKLVNHVSGNGTAFYKVLNAGINQLILLQKQFIKTSPYDPIQGKSISSFYSKRNYAIYNQGKIIPLEDLNKKSLQAALANDASTFELLMKENKSKLKSEKEVIDLLESYNLAIDKINKN
jgi:PIN domain nuclease of toxin-antitoxin system